MSLPASIGILGGVGPWVDPYLLTRMLEYQTALGMRRDQQAIPVLLAQFASLYEDRTEYLADPDRLANPALAAAQVARVLMEAGARVLGVPCNTFHAPAIFARFENEIAAALEAHGARLIHMVRAVAARIRKQHAAVRRVGVLSTDGAYRHGIYRDALVEFGLEPVLLPWEDRRFDPAEQAARRDAVARGEMPPLQNDVHHAITNPEWGIKSGQGAAQGYPQARAVLLAAARRLQDAGAEVIVLGCTEIPLALRAQDLPTPLADPVEILAQELVDAWRELVNPAWPAPREHPSRPK